MSTFIPKKISFSRVVFFYKILLDNILTKKNIDVVCFKKIIHKKNKKNIIFKALKLLGYNLLLKLI